MIWYEQLLQRWPDFIVTFLGVLLGALLAYYGEARVARWQLNRLGELEDQRERGQLAIYLERVINELQQITKRIRQLMHILANTEHARVDLFEWAAVLSDSLANPAYDELVSSGRHRKMPQQLQGDLFAIYQRVADLRTTIRAGAPAIRFFLGYRADQESADLVLDIARTQWLTYEHDLDALVGAVGNHVTELKEQATGPMSRRIRVRV